MPSKFDVLMQQISRLAEADTNIPEDPRELTPESPPDLTVHQPLGAVTSRTELEATASLADKAGVDEPMLARFLELLRAGNSVVAIAAELDIDMLKAQDIYISLKQNNYASAPELSENYKRWKNEGRVPGQSAKSPDNSQKIRVVIEGVTGENIEINEADLRNMIERKRLHSFFASVLPESEDEDALAHDLEILLDDEEPEIDIEEEDADEDIKESLLQRYLESEGLPDADGAADPDKTGTPWLGLQALEPAMAATSYALAYAECLSSQLAGMNPEGLGASFGDVEGDEAYALISGVLDDGRDIDIEVNFEASPAMYRVSVPDSDGYIEMRVITPQPLRNMSLFLQRANNLVSIEEYRYNETNEIPTTPEPGLRSSAASQE